MPTQKTRAENQRGNYGWLLLLVSLDTISKMIKYKYTRLITKNVTFFVGKFHIDVGRWMIKNRFSFALLLKIIAFFTDAREETRSNVFFLRGGWLLLLFRNLFLFFFPFCNGNMVFFARMCVCVSIWGGGRGCSYLTSCIFEDEGGRGG